MQTNAKNQKTNGVPDFSAVQTVTAEVMPPQNNDSFLPENYKVPKKSDQFMKVTPGKHRVRIMTAPIRGFVFFSEEKDESGETKFKPVRRTEEFGNFTAQEMVDHGCKVDAKGKVESSKYFWLMIVWNYSEKRFQALELTQTTVIDALVKYINEPEYGDPRGYDVTIERTGTGKNGTKYALLPSPPKPLDSEVADTFEQLVYNLGNVLENEYPFS